MKKKGFKIDTKKRRLQTRHGILPLCFPSEADQVGEQTVLKAGGHTCVKICIQESPAGEGDLFLHGGRTPDLPEIMLGNTLLLAEAKEGYVPIYNTASYDIILKEKRRLVTVKRVISRGKPLVATEVENCEDE